MKIYLKNKNLLNSIQNINSLMVSMKCS